MPTDRVDTTRPEYSWIPFFEELARRLHEDGWRDRQGEIVAELKRCRRTGIGFNEHVLQLESSIDPFSLYALLCTNLRWEERLRLFDAYRLIFGIESQMPKEEPIVPYLFQKLFYFTGNDSDGSQSAIHWDLFRAMMTDSDDVSLLMEDSLKVMEVRMSKLTMAMFWARPHMFAHIITVTSALALVNGSKVADPANAREYLELLNTLKAVDPRPIPEINVSEYVANQFRKDPKSKRVWRILAWSDHSGVDDFIASNSAIVSYGIHDIDFAETTDAKTLKDLVSRKTDLTPLQLTYLANFAHEAKRGEVIVMPSGVGNVVQVGYLVSNGAYLHRTQSVDPPLNQRSVAWRHELDVPGIPGRSGTFVQVGGAADEVRRLLLGAETIDEAPACGEPPRGANDMITVQWPSDEIFIEEDEQFNMLSLLRRKQNLILQGPPGTGKTFIARKLAYALMGEAVPDRIASVQFHQSYSYEDFVGGLRPGVNEDEQLVFKAVDGAFLRLCERARKDEHRKYVMLIDEINRGNLSRVFGELMMLIEPDKRSADDAVELQHRLQMPDVAPAFFVPPNVYIIGTMNLADRSLTGMNVAMRRRFGFVTLEPRFESRRFRDWIEAKGMPDGMPQRIIERMKALNQSISDDRSLGTQYAVGHSFFCPGEDDPVNGDWEAWYKAVVNHEIRPLLDEYWFDQPEKAAEESRRLLDA